MRLCRNKLKTLGNQRRSQQSQVFLYSGKHPLSFTRHPQNNQEPVMSHFPSWFPSHLRGRSRAAGSRTSASAPRAGAHRRVRGLLAAYALASPGKSPHPKTAEGKKRTPAAPRALWFETRKPQELSTGKQIVRLSMSVTGQHQKLSGACNFDVSAYKHSFFFQALKTQKKSHHEHLQISISWLFPYRRGWTNPYAHGV